MVDSRVWLSIERKGQTLVGKLASRKVVRWGAWKVVQ